MEVQNIPRVQQLQINLQAATREVSNYKNFLFPFRRTRPSTKTFNRLITFHRGRLSILNS